MTILPKKKLSKDKEGDTNAYRQRIHHLQRHGTTLSNNSTVSSDHLYPISSLAQNHSLHNYNYVQPLLPETTTGRYSRNLPEHSMNRWIGITQSCRNDGGLEVPYNNGSISKKKKRRNQVTCASVQMISSMAAARSHRPNETTETYESHNMENQPDSTSDAAVTNDQLPDLHGNSTSSPPHQNSEDEYENTATVTDQERELTFERHLKATKGFLIKKMKEDGACLFRAISDQIYGDQDMHSIVRNHVCDYMAKNRDFFHQFVTEDFDRYIERKRVDSVHGNHVELQAISEMYNRPIEIYIYEAEPSNVFQSAYRTDNAPIRLSYHNNIHYNSIVDPFAASVGVGLGLPSFNPGAAEKMQMKDAMRASETLYIEQAMYEDKLRATDWEATSDALNEAVIRESRLQFLRDQEKQQQQKFAINSCYSTSSSALNNHSPRSSPPGCYQSSSSGHASSMPMMSTVSSSSYRDARYKQLTAAAPSCSSATSTSSAHVSQSTNASERNSSPNSSSQQYKNSQQFYHGDLLTINGGGKERKKYSTSSLLPASISPSYFRSLSSSPVAASPKSPPRSTLSPCNNNATSTALGANLNSFSSSYSNFSKQQPSPPLCPSPDSAAAVYYSMMSPLSPKLHSPNNELNESMGLSGGSNNSGNSNNPQEYALLRTLMESQIEYYNSLKQQKKQQQSSSPTPTTTDAAPPSTTNKPTSPSPGPSSSQF